MTEDDDTCMREYAHALFAPDPDEGAPETEPAKPSNHVPSEGNNPKPPSTDHDLREFTAALFGREY